MHDICQTQTTMLCLFVVHDPPCLLWGSEIEKHRGATGLRQVEKFKSQPPKKIEVDTMYVFILNSSWLESFTT